jgi:hypothetical protein
MDLFHLKMLLAARRQALRDMSNQMSQEEIDKLFEPNRTFNQTD